eukprot:1159828-Pelagomonas_calceolata.AAC.7
MGSGVSSFAGVMPQAGTRPQASAAPPPWSLLGQHTIILHFCLWFTGALVNAAPLLSGLKTADHAPACYLEPAYLCCKCISIWFAQTWTPYAQSKRPAYSFVKASAPGLSVVHGCFHPVALSVCLAGRNVHLERLLSDDLSYS